MINWGNFRVSNSIVCMVTSSCRVFGKKIRIQPIFDGFFSCFVEFFLKLPFSGHNFPLITPNRFLLMNRFANPNRGVEISRFLGQPTVTNLAQPKSIFDDVKQIIYT